MTQCTTMAAPEPPSTVEPDGFLTRVAWCMCLAVARLPLNPLALGGVPPTHWPCP